MKDLNVINLSSKVIYEINPKDEYPKNYTGDITIYKKNGEQISSSQACLRGGRKAPLLKDEIYNKFEANLKFSNIKSKEINELKVFINNIFKAKNMNLLEKINFN